MDYSNLKAKVITLQDIIEAAKEKLRREIDDANESIVHVEIVDWRPSPPPTPVAMGPSGEGE